MRTTISIGSRVVAITGGARGIGRATAAALVRNGAKVAIGDLDLALAHQTANELGGQTIAIPLDVTNRDSFARFLDEAERSLGPLDVLINNAGIMPLGPLPNETDATARRVLDINVHGLIFGTKLALERMLPRDRGHIVNIASQAGKAPFGGLATYCASKHAVVGFTGSLADELRGTNIHASCVMPAIVRTELSAGLPEPALLKPILPEDVADAIVNALEHPRLNVHVPRTGAAVVTAMALMPARLRPLVEKLLGMEHGVMRIDPSTRAGYEARAAREVTGVGVNEDLVSSHGASPGAAHEIKVG